MTPAEYPAACRKLFLGSPDADRRAVRALELFAAGELDPSGLVVADAGAVLYQLHPGNAAVVWPPGAADPATADALATIVVERLTAAGVKQAQTLLPPAERDRARPLEGAGFRYVTQLAYLCRPVAGAPPADNDLTFAPVAGPDAAFADTLVATYDGTLDCPELNGACTGDEVLAGYHAKADPPTWFHAFADGRAVGVVMLAPGLRPEVLELSYLGLVPSARGRGLGRALLRFALAAASAAEWLTLSVDSRNEPALRLYRDHSFRQFDVQDVFLWRPPA